MKVLTGLNTVLIIVVLILLIKGCNKKPEVSQTNTTTISRDTVYIKHDSTIYSKPTLVKTISQPIEQWSREYLPDTNYQTLLQEYLSLADKFLRYNIQSDSLKVDSIGYVKVTDTVFSNLIQGRAFTYNLKYPIITNTITNTIYPKVKRQLYAGVGVEGNKTNFLCQYNAGLLYKGRKGGIWGASVGIPTNGAIHYGVSKYWLIKLNK